MTHEQFEQAAQYWNKKEKITMPEGDADKIATLDDPEVMNAMQEKYGIR